MVASGFRRAVSFVDEAAGSFRRGVGQLAPHLTEVLENAGRSGLYDEVEIERVRARWENGDMDAKLRPSKQGSENGTLLLGDNHRTQDPKQFKTNAINTASKYKDIPVQEGSITTTDQVGYDWYKPGGGLDQELEKILTFGRGDKAYKVTLEELQEMAKTNKNAKDKLDYYNSMLATGPQRDAFDTIEYITGVEKPRSSLSILETLGDQRYKAPFHKSLEFHHKGMKAIEARIYKRALKLLRDGKATEADLVRLNNLGYDMGIPTGSRKSAGLYMNRMPHQVLHQELMLKDPNFPHSPGLQPSATANVPALRSKPKQFTDAIWKQLKKIDEDFTSFDRDWILERAGKPVKGKYPNLQQAIKKWIAFRQSTAYDFFAVQRLSDLDKLAAKADNMDINELIAFQEQIFRDISQPMTKEGELLEEVWGRMSLEEQVGSFDDAGAGILRQRNELVDRRADIAEVMEQRKIESLPTP